MTNPTLERAARAAYERYNGDGEVAGFAPGNWNDAQPEEQQDFRNVARAVLMAVRDNPDLPGVISVDSGKITANECMATMIDAILAEGE